MTEYGMTYDAATAYIDRYNDMVDRVNTLADRYANGGASSLEDTVGDLAESATPLGDAEPFEYAPNAVSGDAFDLAKTPNEGEPGTWYTNPGSGQMRLYGDDRKAVVDFDFDHDHGQGIPHAHNWINGARGPGPPFLYYRELYRSLYGYGHIHRYSKHCSLPELSRCGAIRHRAQPRDALP
jgi:hypothetical protein